VTEDTPGVESEGCEGGTSGRKSVDEAVECCQQLCMADGDPGCGVESADTLDESDTLVIVSIESEAPNGGGIPRVHIGGTRSRAGDANGLGRGTDASRGWTDALNVLNHAETAGMSSYEGAGDAKRVVDATNGVGSPADALTGHAEVPCVETDAITAENVTEIVSIPRKRAKPPDLPVETTRWTPDAPNGCGSHADASSVRRDAHCAGNGRETPAKEAERVRMRQSSSRTRNSPNGRDIATPKLTVRWRKVSVDGSDVYVPRNAPIDTTNRNIVFGRVESGVEAIAPSVESETAGDGDGDGYGDDGDVGDVEGTTSGGDSDSTRVEAALLAGESQRVRYSRRTRTGNLPVSPRPPTDCTRRPYGHVRRRRRRGRLKIERINEDQVSQTPEDETTYLGRAHVTQPPGNDSDRAYGVYRPRRQRGRIKIVPTNISRTRNGGNAYLRRDNALRSTWRPEKKIREVNKLTFEYRMPGERWRDDEGHE